MKHLKIHKFPFKNVIVLAIECKMYLKIQQKPSLTWLHFKTDHGLRREENKVEFLEVPSSFLHKKKTEHSFELSLPIFYLNGVVLTLKCRTLILKPLDGNRSAAILLKMLGFQIW